MVQLGQLRGLRELILRFPSPTDEYSRVCISPLSRLTNLQRLVVQGVIPTTLQAAAAVGGGGGGGITAAANGGDLSSTFPRSLTSLVLEGHGSDGNGTARLLLRQWMVNVPVSNNIEELHMLNYPSESGCLMLGLDLSMLKQLRHFRVLVAPYHPYVLASCDVMGVPDCLVSLSNLQVIEVGTYGWQLPTMPRLLHVVPDVSSVLDPLVKLKKLGCISVGNLCGRGHGGPILLEELSCHLGDLALPEWMTAASCPQLQRLRLEAGCFPLYIIQSVARLNQLTSLQLSTAVSYVSHGTQTWDDLGVLGTSLPHLHQLILIDSAEVSLFGEVPDASVMPDLSAFTQIKQLQLVYLMDTLQQLPEQPSSTDFLQGLSKLTQLEQLQLEGYSTVTPVIVSFLVERLPQLQLLEVGLCKHPELLKAAGAGDRAEVRWEVSHPGFVEVQHVCAVVQPKLQVKVGYARQMA